MNLSQLQTFRTVCECFSFTEAASKLCITQSAVSRQIAALEAEIGTALFERTHNSIVLTPAGDFLGKHLPPVLESLQETIRQTKRIGDGETGRLNIGLLEDQSLDAEISQALQQLQRNHVYLRIRRYNFRSLESALLCGDIDIAVSIKQGSRSFPDCEFLPYAQEAMCYAIQADALPEKMQSITMDSIRSYEAQYPLLIPSLESFQTAQTQELKGLSAQVGFPAQEYDFSSIAPMVAAGLAATIANETHILSLDRNIRFIPIPENPAVHKGVFRTAKNKNPAISQLLELLGK